ncbi:ChaC-like protein [Stappia aggregata IAM 12614]|uniref:glutathione-specific gamma-glutamylcyclotransferase n=1 Tax=Roseibium aggregatum (strain ATCC 25650 / DSM 13394 / JCM 20685 / NBRC 16684 / NCIMB 2208 / IAM 12614 / B1) TaxID=384765 RepID=A0P3C5_ROSAI|nr:gamma-glutamylcyclotransferase [Roseibium aggregatum]EAV40478.1 ChaC-like protein [Stappia aggregata IAM 12614] [Roseibium aggregatum IAM 12614]
MSASVQHALPSGAASFERRHVAGTDGQASEDPVPAPALTRAGLASGHAASLAAEDDPGIRLMSETERAASLEAFMAHRPAGDVWVFAYGSLIWNPAMNVVERRYARVEGWHRAFCLSMTAGRGTKAQPGLALGLDRGRACTGLAYRLNEDQISTELPLLWSREMLFGGYIPQWVGIQDKGGGTFGAAIAFTIDRQHRHYAGALPRAAIVRHLATATGSWGSAANYLFRTVNALRQHGIHDADLETVAAHVAATLLTP